MRHIDNTHLQIDDGWQRRADAALAEAREKPTDDERKEYINSRAELWSELKPKLEVLSSRKCWYCESAENRSDRAVDHFRPKNRVRERPDHPGYWWRAFIPVNYRLCCTFCNSPRKDRETAESGGKSDHFPLVQENRRVFREEDDTQCRYEMPMLLDPCKATDVALLTFNADGRAVPKHSQQANEQAFKRADYSLTCYNLNERDIKEARLGLYNDISNFVTEGDYHFQDSLNGNDNAERALELIMKKLAEMKHQKAEYSAFANAIIQGFTGQGREWVEAIDLITVN